MRLLIFAGAGTSVELGVPAMPGLASDFYAHCQQWKIEPDLVHKFHGSEDIEALIEALDQIENARTALLEFGTSVPFDGVHTIRSEVEWFIQHAAEKIAATDAQLMWGRVLSIAANHTTTIVTTNYDRAIELAANAIGLDLNDGFATFSGNEAANWTEFGAAETPQLVKLHGSTDWYADMETNHPKKLRHPMPLFGSGTLRLANGDVLGSAMVLPSREKLLSRDPYPRMSHAFLSAADECDLAIFVGSSFRDLHVRSRAQTIAKTRPVFVVNRSGSSQGIANASSIAQPASVFLTSTLPTALAQSDPVAALNAAVPVAETAPNVIHLLRIATDPLEPPERRCGAIEELDALSLALGKRQLSPLLSDPDPNIARYALGLVSISPDCLVLMEEARTSSHTQEYAFKEELTLLAKLVSHT